MSIIAITRFQAYIFYSYVYFRLLLLLFGFAHDGVIYLVTKDNLSIITTTTTTTNYIVTITYALKSTKY